MKCIARRVVLILHVCRAFLSQYKGTILNIVSIISNAFASTLNQTLEYFSKKFKCELLYPFLLEIHWLPTMKKKCYYRGKSFGDNDLMILMRWKCLCRNVYSTLNTWSFPKRFRQNSGTNAPFVIDIMLSTTFILRKSFLTNM